MTRPRSLASLAATIALALPAAALAAWTVGGEGPSMAKAQAVDAIGAPDVAVSGRNVTVNWSAPPGGAPPNGYTVRRYRDGGAEDSIGAGCTGTVTATSCTEQAVPPGDWRYSVTPVRHSWRGPESPRSAVASVAAPALSLAPATVTSLPATLTGQLTGYREGQTVTFRLDDETSGPELAGSITPSPVPGDGTAAVSVTLPAGTANGTHTVYAIGSAGDVAAATVTVAVPTTISTTAWDLRDLSTGTVETNQSDRLAFSDNRILPTQAFPTSFSSGSYVEYELNDPLRTGLSTSSVAFDYRYAVGTSGVTGCFYLEVRRASSGEVIETRGSAANPLGCVTGTTLASFSVPLSSVATTDVANDLVIRVYGRATTASSFIVDRATVAGTSPDGAFTLYPDALLDRANGNPIPFAWALFANDSIYYDAQANWGTSYASNRYLRFTFPAYVPSGATVQSATLTHAYRASVAGARVCNYIQIYAGTTLIGSRGSPTSDLSCATGNLTNTIDTIELPEVDTAARANSLSVRVYYVRRGSTATRSRDDRIRLSITYTAP